jgi:iron donor protein CyaY
MDEQQFKRDADRSLDSLYKRLSVAGEKAEFEADFSAGALAIEFENSATKFVISPNTPVRQIWVSAHSRSFKLDWDAAQGAFILADSGQTLTELIQEAIGQELGEPITL